MRKKKRIWVISELYYPEETSTGYYMTKIAEGLSSEFEVKVLCAQPSYSKRGLRAPKKERHNGVDIFRCYSTTLDKNKLLHRVFNLLTISFSIFFNALLYLRSNDIAFVVTNPPLLPYIILMVCKIRGAKCIVRIDDVYPDVLYAAGLLKKNSLAYHQAFDWLTKQLFIRSDHIITLGRDMKELVSRKINDRYEHISIVTNWADSDLINPMPKEQNGLLSDLGLIDKFVVQWAGNMGYPHEVKSIFEAMIYLKDHPYIHFLFIGSGSKRAWFETKTKQANIKNVTFLGNRPRNDQQNFLNACDIAISSLVKGMVGISVPSRMYNIMAAGKPILSIGEDNSELGLVLKEEGIGWVVPPNNPKEIVRVILFANENRNLLFEMGKRARLLAETKYSAKKIINNFIELFSAL